MEGFYIIVYNNWNLLLDRLNNLQKIILNPIHQSIAYNIKNSIPSNGSNDYTTKTKKGKRDSKLKPYNPLISYVKIFKEIYKLPIIPINISVNDPQEFLEIRLNPIGIEAFIFNNNNEFLIHCINNNKTVCSLPHIFIDKEDNLNGTMDRWFQENLGFSIDSIYPIAIIEYRVFHDSEIVNQTNLLFITRIRNKKSNAYFIKQSNQNHYKWIPRNQFDLLQHFKNSDIQKYIFTRVDQAPPVPTLEIDSHTETRLRYKIHRNTMAKMVYPLCSAKIRKKIIDIIYSIFNNRKDIRIFDAACGDDTLLLDFRKYFPNGDFVCNDISYVDIMKLARSDRSKKIVFTNHDLRDLPFNGDNNEPIFDVIILKNTLHHLKKKDVFRVLHQLQKIGRLIIIVEIEDPLHSSLLARIWNFYYVHFLKDIGTDFLTYEQFKFIVNKCVPNGNKAVFNSINTFKGKYLFGIISNMDKI